MGKKYDDKFWMFLPFAGGSKEHPEREIASKHQARKENQDGDDPLPLELSRAETAKQFADKKEEDIVADYNSPIHMWVVATLFPLVAGTFGPMASMFNICAIAISWRVTVQIPEGSDHEANGHHIPDPHWLVAVNIVSLVIAIVANISLLGQMTNRLRYNISGPITIVGFYISGFVDIGLVAAASSYLKLGPNPHTTYSQGFYYAAFSGGIYVILAMMLSVTAYGIWFGHYSTEFKLSLSQRSLMLQTILFLAYVLAAGAVYSDIEDWSYLDATYFVVVTVFTIGFGDIVPTTHLGRSLFFPFAVGGIIFVGVIIANIRTLVLESGSVKVSTRLVEKARFKAIKAGDPDQGVVRLRGVRKRSTSGETELERREKEFNIMRDIQDVARRDNRLVSLLFATAAFMILWFIGAIVFWKAETESVGGENWSYFESLYFTFVAQVTIGYGDFEPQTNSSKPAFVFWALIALPTLTVLIGSVGDAVSAFVNWYTVWVGKHTINLWHITQAFTTRKSHAELKDAAKEAAGDDEKDAEAGFREISNLERRETVPADFPMHALTDDEAQIAEHKYRPFIMLKAAQKILEHLDEDPPRKYTFKEWAWLLKLLGEDEDDSSGHRRVGTQLPEGAEVVSPVRTEKHQVWSWLGQESPLMSLEDDSEPKWVLRRLMWELEKDLKGRAERHIDRDLGHVKAATPETQTQAPGSSGSEKENNDK